MAQYPADCQSTLGQMMIWWRWVNRQQFVITRCVLCCNERDEKNEFINIHVILLIYKIDIGLYTIVNGKAIILTSSKMHYFRLYEVIPDHYTLPPGIVHDYSNHPGVLWFRWIPNLITLKVMEISQQQDAIININNMLLGNLLLPLRCLSLFNDMLLH